MEIAKSEGDAVFRIRLVVILILILSTASLAFGVYRISRGAEETEFENKYYDDSSKIFEAVSSNLDSTLGAIDSFVVNMVSMAKFSNQSWPFVYTPDYGIRSAKLRSAAKAAYIHQYHLVSAEQRLEWEAFTYLHGDQWVDEALAIQEDDQAFKGPMITNYTSVPVIYNNDGVTPYNSTGPFLPKWQSYPVVPTSPPFNYDVLTFGDIGDTFFQWAEEKGAFIGPVTNLSPEGNEWWSAWIAEFAGTDDDPTEPFGDIYYPILRSFGDSVYYNETAHTEEDEVAGSFTATYFFRELIRNILPTGSDGIVTVFENDCDQKFSYQINGPDTLYLGPDDFHDPAFDAFQRVVQLVELDSFAPGDGAYSGLKLSAMGCQYKLYTYPSTTMQDSFLTTQPAIFTGVTVIIFLFTSAVFLLYDWLVERRQKKVMKSAMQTNAIVSSLFPSNVRDRLLNQNSGSAGNKKQIETTKNRMNTFMQDGKRPNGEGMSDAATGLDDRPIADLFPDCTVMFGDIAGFTAWSSTREPSQVFILLETIYGAFDKVADRRRVFKVETIGDSYVAACGLPNPRRDHALVMVKFAADCREQFCVLTRNLETKLGPDTGDLAMRFGLHSGPVTAGVLRGQKSRFQLFGDTVNTAARMESTGDRNLIQVSQTTADCLIECGKKLWLRAREELVEAKGKGKMQTYWAEAKTKGSSVFSVPMFPSAASSAGDGASDDESRDEDLTSPMRDYMVDKAQRMVDWNVEILSRSIRQIIARRNATKSAKQRRKSSSSLEELEWNIGQKQVLTEVKEIIELPAFDGTKNDLVFSPLEDSVSAQLCDFVIAISSKYHDNPFHNFDHASHVTMSVAKLMSRITDASAVANDAEQGNIASSLHDHTYGITSDPLTQFACLISALIHDVDHPGVPNTQLVKEKTKDAKRYKGRSVAEQKSVDVAWNLLIQPQYEDLRLAVCETEDEMRRFRQLVVNAVMATDIMDKGLKALRDGRWEKAFDGSTEEPERDHVNRKATIVIEHLIQASDVAHTMQHWHIYRKWNERLFQEMYFAYQSGRAKTDPSESWYKGELGFFDFYIIPLAKKLSECGVFGVSSDEYLNYAQTNRAEWEERGEEIVAGMINRLKKKEEAKEEHFIVDGEDEDCEVPLKG